MLLPSIKPTINKKKKTELKDPNTPNLNHLYLFDSRVHV